MKDGKDNHRIPANPKLHGIWEAACHRSSNLTKYNWITRWAGRSVGDRLIDFDNKFFTKTCALFVVSIGRIIEFSPC